MRLVRSCLARGAAAAIAFSLVGATASAQEVALSRYEVPVAGDTFFSVFGPNVDGHLVPRGQLTLGYDHRPFVLLEDSGAELAVPSSRRLFVHASASLALLDRILVSVDAPFAVAQGGDGVDFGGGLELVPTQGAAVGEARVGVRGRILGAAGGPFQLGVGGFVYLPTATDAWGGEGYVYGQPTVQLGGRASVIRYGLHVGSKLRPSQDPISLTYAAALGVALLDGRLTFGPEFFGSYDVTKGQPVFGVLELGSKTSGEVLGGVQFRFLEDFVVGGAGGVSLTTSVGSPELRGLLRFAYSPPPGPPPPPPPVDTDGDGVFDPKDACPKVRGVPSADVLKNGCPPPPPDEDADGVPDKVDACQKIPGVTHADPKKNGCPADTDDDGVPDAEDGCVAEAGSKEVQGADRGCPDGDKDGIADRSDACVDVFGFENAEPSTRGCPRAVVTEKEIVINQRIEFETEKAVLLPESELIIDAVAALLAEFPEIASIEVAGHTDDLGDPSKNYALSQNRARTVTMGLTKRKIDGSRLVPRGYGATRPLSKEKTPEALQKNRRVEFKILRRNSALRKK